jgi:glycosyltransferase involved in cell wall biosynthesis
LFSGARLRGSVKEAADDENPAMWKFGERPVRILWVKADKILPVHSGGNIRSYQILRQLASRHELVFFSYYGGGRDAEYEEEITRQLPGAVCLCTGKRELTSLRRGLDYLRKLPARAPYAVSRFKSAPVQESLRNWFQERRFDVAVCDFLDAAVNFPGHLAIPAVLFQHNVESEIWRRHALTAHNPIRRLLYRAEFKKMLSYEQSMVRKFHHVIAVSEHDRRLMSEWTDSARITVVPTGVDLHEYQPDRSSRPVEPLVLFVGAMDWEPNIDAVEYFCREIWPLIQGKVPAARFRIVGRNPVRRVQRLASSSVEITGSVPSVVDHLRESAVVVVPLRVGGGTRLKIYEAMAAGKAVVSTSVGAEGLDVANGQDILLADDPGAFAAPVTMLLEDVELRRRYERAAATLAAKYDWAAIGDKFGQVLERLLGTAWLESSSYAESGVLDVRG